jgi:hypothetical protein
MNYKKILLAIILLFFIYSLVNFYKENYKVIETNNSKEGKITKKAKDKTKNDTIKMSNII